MRELGAEIISPLSSLLELEASISLIIPVYFSQSLVNFGSLIEMIKIAEVIDPMPMTMQPSISKSVKESCIV